MDAENTPEVQAHFTWLKGSHAIKTGYDMLFCQFNTFRPDYPSGSFSFSRNYTQGAGPVRGIRDRRLRPGERDARRAGQRQLHRRTVAGAVADQLQLVPAGRLEGLAQSDGEPGRSFRIPDAVQGALQPPRLLRPERDRAGHRTEGRSARPPPARTVIRAIPNYNWAPRVGLAWTFLPDTVFRAGYGIFYAPGSGGVGSSPGDLGSGSSVATATYFGQAPGGAQLRRYAGASLANPFVTGLLPYPNSLVGNGIGAIFPNWTTPMNQMWNANIQRNVDQQPFGGSRLHRQPRRTYLEQLQSQRDLPAVSLAWARSSTTWCPTRSSARSPPAAMSAATVRLGSLLVPYPQYGGINQIRASVGDSIYHGFTLRAERSFSHGLLVPGVLHRRQADR